MGAYRAEPLSQPQSPVRYVVFKNVPSALFTAFLVVAFIRAPESAGDLVATVGAMMGVLVEEFKNVVAALFS